MIPATPLGKFFSLYNRLFYVKIHQVTSQKKCCHSINFCSISEVIEIIIDDDVDDEGNFLSTWREYRIRCTDLNLSPICRDDTFADIHNLDHCIKYLNQSLVTFGFPSSLNLYSSEPVSMLKCRSFDSLRFYELDLLCVKEQAIHTTRDWMLSLILHYLQGSIVRTCNCIYAMIQQRQRDIEYRETANETRQRCKLMLSMAKCVVSIIKVS